MRSQHLFLWALAVVFAIAGVATADTPQGMQEPQEERGNDDNHASAWGSAGEAEQEDEYDHRRWGEDDKNETYRQNNGVAAHNQEGADHITIVPVNGSVFSNAYIKDTGGDKSSLTGNGRSNTSLSVTVVADEAKDKVYLWFFDDLLHDIRAHGEGKKYRKVNNTGYAEMIDGTNIKWYFGATFKQGVSEERGGRVRGGWNGGKPTFLVEGGGYNHYGADVPLDYAKPLKHDATNEFVGTGSVTGEVFWGAKIEQNLEAQGGSGEHAWLDISKYDMIHEISYDYGISTWISDSVYNSTVWAGDGTKPKRYRKPVPTPSRERLAIEYDPIGLASDSKMKQGMLRIELDPGEFGNGILASIRTTPSSMTSLPGQIVLNPEDGATRIMFDAITAGTYLLEVDLLDENMQVTETLSTAGENTSLGDVSSPQLGALVSDSRAFARFGETRLEAGMQAVQLCVWRTPFADVESDSTTFTITASDPDGVLSSPPTSATIDAGDLRESLSVNLTSNVGTAQLTFESGSHSTTVDITAVEQAIDANKIDVIYMPIGSKAPCAFHLTYEAQADWSYDVTADPGLTVHGLSAGSHVVAEGSTLGMFTLEAGSTAGTYTCTISDPTSQVDSKTITVYVQAEDVALGRTNVDVLNVDPTNNGIIELTLPEGVVFETASVGPSGQGSVTVSGTGSNKLELDFTEEPTRPTTVSVAFTLAGDNPNEPVEFEVLDGLHTMNPVNNTYRVLVQ